VPADRVAALRKAFMQALHDKALLAEAANMQLDIDALSGEDLQALVTKLYALPPAVAARTKEALVYKPPQ
jgi:tripartite-type tricarboxylate transporter receptor subunit TctC